jgi:hypothetical protein
MDTRYRLGGLNRFPGDVVFDPLPTSAKPSPVLDGLYSTVQQSLTGFSVGASQQDRYVSCSHRLSTRLVAGANLIVSMLALAFPRRPIAHRYRSAERMTAAFPSRSITV